MGFNQVLPLRARVKQTAMTMCISQSSSITGTSLSDCLVSYSGHSLGEGLTLQQRSSRCILLSQPTGWLAFRIPFMDQIDLLKNYSYSIGILETISSSKFGDRRRGWHQVSFSIASTRRGRGECNSFHQIVPLYPWSVPYKAEC